LAFKHKRIKINYFTIVAVLLDIFTIQTSAEEVVDGPIVITITGTHLPVSQQQETGSSYVINRQQIERLNARSVSQLLQTLPGLYVENDSSKGSINTVYFRGAEPNYVLVLIDGVKVNDPSNSRGGAFNFSLLNVSTIERIEIVKGSYSSVYGSDAMAGVINIVTRKTNLESTASVRAEVGSRSLRNISVQSSIQNGDARFTLGASYYDDGEQVNEGKFVEKSVVANGDLDWTSQTKLSINAFHQNANSRAFPDDSGGDKYAVIRSQDESDSVQQNITLALSHQIHPNRSVNATVGFFQSTEAFASPGIYNTTIPAYDSDSDYKRHKAELIFTSEISSKFDASIGASVEREDATSKGSIYLTTFNVPTDFKLDRSLHAVFAEARYRFTSDIQVNAGLRDDIPKEFNDRVSPRIEISIAKNKTIYNASWSEGYKLPSFFALAHPIVGNPDFKPETSESYELGIQHKFTHALEANLAVFRHTYFDLIDFDNSGVLVQRSSVQIKGVELNARQHYANKVDLEASYTATHFSIKNSANTLLKRPEWKASIRVNWAIMPTLNLAGNANYIGPIEDFAFPTGQRTLDSYLRVNASMNWQWYRQWRLQLAVDNVLDKKYQQTIGTDAPGLGVRVAITGTF